MTEELEPNIDSTIRIWAPDPKAHPGQYDAMRKLAGMGDALVSLLQSNGITSAEIMVPHRRGDYVPDDDFDYEIFASPDTLKATVEGLALYDAIRAATGLVGWLNHPYEPKYTFKLAVEDNGFTLLHRAALLARQAS